MGIGGYRYGAGRPGWRRKCEQCLRLDLRQLKARDLLRPGWFSLAWSWNGMPSGSVGITMSADCMRVDYQLTPHDAAPRNLCSVISLVRLPCRFGGARTWFLCPDCQRRCLVVYGFNRFGHFSCRRCLHLVYASEAEDTMGRLWRKTRKLESRLGEDGERPKAMHWNTYDRICAKIDEVEAAKDREFFLAARSFLRGVESRR